MSSTYWKCTYVLLCTVFPLFKLFQLSNSNTPSMNKMLCSEKSGGLLMKKLVYTREGMCGICMLQGRVNQWSGTEWVEQLSWVILPQDAPLL